MINLIRKYNLNRKELWTVIIVIVLILLAIRFLNNYYKNADNFTEEVVQNTTSSNSSESYSVVSKENIEEETNEELTNVIKEFITYCNNKEIEKAYELLTNDCKKMVFPTIEEFEKNYVDKIFSTKKIYNLQAWINNFGRYTYKVELKNNYLATGNASNSFSIEEYYTCVRTSDGYKLNINGYIGYSNINKEKLENNINIKIVNKVVFADYEIYNIEITNKTGNEIILDSKSSTKKVYIVDENNIKHVCFLSETNENDLKILNGQTKSISLKFDKTYSSEVEIEKIVFEDINILTTEKEIIKIEMEI